MEILTSFLVILSLTAAPIPVTTELPTTSIPTTTWTTPITTSTTTTPEPTTTSKPKPKCGYESCPVPKDGFINVHLVPHTHDDVGWLKTVDQYFYGSKQKIQQAGVQNILDSVIDALRKNPDRRFIYVETAFFWKWWIKQHDLVKHQVKKFVNNGQLEFIGGGWVMNDEATTHYQSIIDQFTWGLRRLNETFGECGRPKVGWQIDPFGHSREMASLFAQMGYDGLLLGRIDYQDKAFRFHMKTAESIWKGSESLGNKANLFTSVLYNNYAPPPGFCFDVLCEDDPIIDDKKSPEYNVDKMVEGFLQYVHNMTRVYATNNVLVTMGEDFNYQQAEMWFRNLDKLILYANKLQKNGSKFNLFYSTPSCYIKAVNDEGSKRHLSWPVKDDDFFPYASDPTAYWTGYFTSRPTLKRFERVGNNFLQVCKQLYALTDLGPEDWTDLNVLREAMGVLQHHDAVAGTEKEHVAHDYARLLSRGFDECEFVAATALSKLVTGKNKAELNTQPMPEIPFESCVLRNISQCNMSESSQQFIVTVYNPLSRPVSQYVRFPVLGAAYQVLGPDGKEVQTQVIPLPEAIKNIPGRESRATMDIVFRAENIPPLGFKSYYVRKISFGVKPNPTKITDTYHSEIGIDIDKDTGLISSVMMNGVKISVKQELLYYKGAVGNNEEYSNRSSGAYIFRPNGTNAYTVADRAILNIYKGEHVIEVQQKFGDWASQIIRLYKEENFIEFDWLVGPIPISDIVGKEIISRFSSELSSESTFYTDSNGRETIKRVRDFRPTWKLSLNESVPGNYYPVTSKILIRDQQKDLELAVLTDRAQGGSSLRDGEIELMVHRTCLHDDAFGVAEPLIEEAFGTGLVARGSHYLIAGPYLKDIQGKTLAAQQRDVAQRKLLEAWTFFSPTNNLPFKEYANKYKMEYSGLKSALPENVQILTLEPWKGMSFLLRLEHVFEKNEDPVLSKPAKVDLQDLFTPFKIQWIKETTLGGNQWIGENERLQFTSGPKLEQLLDVYMLNVYSADNRSSEIYNYTEKRKLWRQDQSDSNYIYMNKKYRNEKGSNLQEAEGGNMVVTLNPMEIRTFVIEIQKTS